MPPALTTPATPAATYLKSATAAAGDADRQAAVRETVARVIADVRERRDERRKGAGLHTGHDGVGRRVTRRVRTNHVSSYSAAD